MASNYIGSRDSANKVFFADARDMREIADGSVGLIVTSPPYFNVKDYSLDGRQEKSHSKSHAKQIGDINDFAAFIDELKLVWRECNRVLKPNGKLIINVPLMPMLKAEFSTHENRHIFDLNAAIQNSILKDIPGIYLLDTYIWNRTNPSKKLMFGSYPYPSNFYAQNTVEFVTVYVKEGKAVQPSKKVKEQSKLTQEEWVEYTKQIWNLPIPGKGDLAFGTHSALMPEQIAERCIRLYSFVGEIVLDPFTGSGTTLRVAKKLDRKFIGYELMEAYEEIIEKKVGKNVCFKVDRKAKKVQATKAVVEIDPKFINTISRANALDFIKKLPDVSVDLICVDPPYNLNKGDWDKFENDNDFLQFTYNWIELADKKLKNGGSFYIFNTPRNSAYILTKLEKMGYKYQNWITWNKKDGFTSTKKRFLPEQESIIFVTKPGADPIFNSDAVRVPYESTERIAAAQTTGILKNGKRWYPNKLGRLCSDVWNFASERHNSKVDGKVKTGAHPTIKPLAMMERIILASSNENDIVLDFFAGSGSTLLAAAKHNRRYIGCEINPEYVKLAKSRIKRELDI